MASITTKFVILVLVYISVSTPVESRSTSNEHRVKRGAPSSDVANRQWPNATIYYIIDDKLEPIRDQFRTAMDQIESLSCVRYVPRTTESDYVYIVNDTICKEPVGRQGGQQKIQISIPECGVFGFFLHASMQVLGFYHEHQRFDRDEYVDVFEENIDPEWLDWSFSKLNETTHFYNSTYDINSIMHYGSYEFSINGKPTILAKNGSEIIPWTQKTAITDLDKEAINTYYGC